MQVLPGSLGSIVNRLIGLGTDRTAQAFHFAGEIKMDLTLLRLEPDVGNLPRVLKTQGGGEEDYRFHAMASSMKT